MSSRKAITFDFEIRNRATGELQKVSISAKSAEEAMAKMGAKTQTVMRQIQKGAAQATTAWASLSVAMGGLQSVMSQTMGVVSDMTAAYATQMSAETKLETVMRQRMGATDAEIESVKRLASAQQDLGVIGDEVQLAGAQQLSTFLGQKDSIDTLLPAMNNLLAQQKGLSATGGDAVNVANLMGKAMQGQTGALRRVGITFDAAQEKVLKYGTESQRAAMLATVITQNVGEMNSALAQTDAGRQQQLANTMGDYKEKIGAAVQAYQPFLTCVSATITSVAGMMQFGSAIAAAGTAIKGAATSMKAMTAAVKAHVAASKAAIAVSKAWKAIQLALNITMSANPIGVIVMAVAGLVAAFRIAYVHCDSFRGIVDKIWAAMKTFGAAVLDVAKWLWDKLVVAFKKLCEWGQVVWYYFKKIFGITDNSTAPAANAAAAAVGDIGEQAEDAADAVDGLNDLIKDLDKDKDKDKKKGPQYTAGQKRGRDLSVDVYDLTTIEQYTARIDKLRKMQETANARQYAELQRQIEQVERIKEGFENAYKVMERPAQIQNIWQIVSASAEAKKSVEKIVKDTGVSFAEAAKGIANKTGETFAQVLKDAAPAVRRYADMVGKEVNRALGFKFDSKRPDNLQPTQGARKLAEKNEERKGQKQAKFDMGTLQGGWGGIKSGVDAVQSLTDALKGNADAWTVLKTVIDSVFQIFQAVTSVIQMVTMFSNLLSGSKNAEIAATVASTTATEADTKAKEANAAAGFFAAHAYIPFVGAEIAAGYVGLMKGVVAGVRAFADGGIAYGPTLGLFGEYPGASNNPEVVAPLSKLRDLIGNTDTGSHGGVVEFRIKGRNLEGVLQKRNKLTART